MSNINRSPLSAMLPAMLLAALCLPAAVIAQTEPGSFDDILADFEPLQEQTPQPLPELNAPLIMGPQAQQQAPSLPRMNSVLEVPRVEIDEPPSNELLLPNLTMPTPENTAIDSFENRRSLKPQLNVQPPDPIELLPFDNREAGQLPAQARSTLVQPRMQSPQALNYGSRAYSSRSRAQFMPVQVEFFSVEQRFGFPPFGGFRPGFGAGYGIEYRPYGGYVPYGGYGLGNSGRRYCPNGR